MRRAVSLDRAVTGRIRNGRLSRKDAWLSSAFAAKIGMATAFLLTFPTGTMHAADEQVRLELNKLEDREQSCRIHLVLENMSADGFTGYKLDLVLFGPDGIIARRIAVDVAPLRARKTSVKLFDVDALACGSIGSVLVNDVLDCRGGAGETADCVEALAVSTRASVSISK
ncbi:MAG: Tat pathway signal sequence domain protein [Dongiaceae bacterium]